MFYYTILEGAIFQKVSPEVKLILERIKNKKYAYIEDEDNNILFYLDSMTFQPFRASGKNPYVLARGENGEPLYFNRKEQILIAESLLKEEDYKKRQREEKRTSTSYNKLKSILKKQL